ncbi:MAG: hypothetical protein KY453_11715, partial [Gemmatimonadetes bacterium]|nr:hypothetical protein [Gemmatimonadota bacterium]
MADDLLQFLVGLATDPDRLAAFHENRDAVLAEAGIPEADAALLRQGSPDDLYTRLVTAGGEAAGGGSQPVYPPPVYEAPSGRAPGAWPCSGVWIWISFPCVQAAPVPPAAGAGRQFPEPPPVYPPPVYPPPVYPPPVYPPPVYPPPVYTPRTQSPGE